MDTQKKGHRDHYQEITQEDFRNGMLELKPELRDGKETGLYELILHYGTYDDREALLALAKINNEQDGKILKNRFQILMNPTLQDLTAELALIERTFKDKDYGLTNAGHELFFEGATEVEIEEYKDEKRQNAILPEQRYLKKEDEKEVRKTKLESLIRDFSNDEKRRFLTGKESFYTLNSMLFINTIKLPETYEEAVEVEEKLNGIEGLSKEDMVNYMKENSKESFEQYEKLLQNRENKPKEEWYVEKIKTLLTTADVIRSHLYQEKGEQMSFFLDVIHKAGYSFDVHDLDGLLQAEDEEEKHHSGEEKELEI